MTALVELPVVSEAEIRRSLRAQIARLESQLPPGPARTTGPARLLSVDELERIRDDLVGRIQERRYTDGPEQERKRRLREELWLDPRGQYGVTVSNAEVGEPGCTRWASWFRLTVSGGCP